MSVSPPQDTPTPPLEPEPLPHLPGTPVITTELCDLGFTAFELAFDPTTVTLPEGSGARWTTLGPVPDSPGLYAFTVSDRWRLHVTYVGLTGHLWMVTKGRLPGGQGLSRPGNRYGNPKYAGVTRRRVNVLIAEQLRAGRTITHWLNPRPIDKLPAEEEQLIRQWRLRATGWNVG